MLSAPKMSDVRDKPYKIIISIIISIILVTVKPTKFIVTKY